MEFSYGEKTGEVLHGINLSIQPGTVNALVGPSGSGKSTLLNIIGGIDNADSGYIAINGEKTADMDEKALTLYRRKHLGYVFQMYNLIGNLNVKENIEVGAYLSDHALDIDELLHTLGLYEHRYKLPNQLSGGQQQRVALARTLAQNPKIILADEPVAALDPVTAKQVMSDFKKINQEMNITILINIHHVELALAYADRIIGIRAGKIVYDGPSENVTQDVLNTIYEGKIPEKTEEA